MVAPARTAWRSAGTGAVLGMIAGLLIFLGCAAVIARDAGGNVAQAWSAMLSGGADVPWRTVFWTVLTLSMSVGVYASLSTGYLELTRPESMSLTRWQKAFAPPLSWAH